MKIHKLLNNDQFIRDIFKILLSFILFYTIGGYLSHKWQEKEHENQILIEKKRYEKESATVIFEEISRQMNRQISNFQLFLKDQSYEQKCIDEYLDWNENKTRLNALTEKYFGKSASQSLAYISDQYEISFAKLILFPEQNENSNHETSLNQLELEIRNFNTQLISDLLDENIGSNK